ncbi:MAG: NAD-dependent epimerase/dehydratase family protein [Myxococcales bacterium]|nr:NAD-dependent epimerase/dehydratase family protein [Myxococcales bacterium]
MATRKTRRQTLLVTGIASRMGRMLARQLHEDFDLIGIDQRGARLIPKNVMVHAVDMRRRPAEDVFRRNRIDAVVHLGEEDVPRRRGERQSPLVTTARRVLELCQAHSVPKVIVLSSALIYGPNPENDQYLTEDAPVQAGQRFSTMRDRVEIDLFSGTFFWQHAEADTVLLRPAAIVGRLDNAPSRYFGLRAIPTVLGFDPMMQVVSPEDVLLAIQLALKPGVRGVFNIAGPRAVPLSMLIHKLRKRNVPIPEPAFPLVASVVGGLPRRAFPRPEIDYLKYVCMVDDSRARSVLGYEPKLSLEQTLLPLVA